MDMFVSNHQLVLDNKHLINYYKYCNEEIYSNRVFYILNQFSIYLNNSLDNEHGIVFLK